MESVIAAPNLDDVIQAFKHKRRSEHFMSGGQQIAWKKQASTGAKGPKEGGKQQFIKSLIKKNSKRRIQPDTKDPSPQSTAAPSPSKGTATTEHTKSDEPGTTLLEGPGAFLDIIIGAFINS